LKQSWRQPVVASVMFAVSFGQCSPVKSSS